MQNLRLDVQFSGRTSLKRGWCQEIVATGDAKMTTNRRASVQISGLKTEYLDRPLGVEALRPRFSWRVESEERNVLQSAYRILVASDEEILNHGRGDLWDSGKVVSRKSVGVKYSGRPLASRQRCWWRVQVWDEKGGASAPSTSSWWEMGLLGADEWAAQWLAAEDTVARADRGAGLTWIWGGPMVDDLRPRKFRYKFRLPVSSVGGEFFASANGWYGKVTGIWIDGVSLAAGEVEQSPAQWLALEPIGAGEHLIAVEVEPAALVRAPDIARSDGVVVFARLSLANGDTCRIGSGPNWKVASTEEARWYLPGYDDERWESAQRSRIEGYEPWPARPAVYLRREFSLDKLVLKARLYATTFGAYEAYLNGERVGDALLTPGPSQYAKRILYQIYDVTDQLHYGRNALGLIVGDGWFGSAEGRFEWGSPPRRLLAQLEVTFIDGSREIIGTGPGWRIAESPIRASQIRIGEVYDARYEKPGWDSVEFCDSQWREAEIVPPLSSRLTAQVVPPVRTVQLLKPKAISQPKPGIYVFDFGQNFAGWCRLHVKGDEGTRIELRFAELLTLSGEVESSFNLNMGEPKRDIFVLRGKALGETFEPRFTYRGFRYVEVRGLPAAPTSESLEGIVIHSDLEMTGKLRIDNALIESIWETTVRTQRANFVGIPTDCPSREQRGWMADCGIFWDAAAFNMDVCAFSSRQMDNAVDGQDADGAFTDFAPWPAKFAGTIAGSPGWGDAGIIIPWVVWQRYGDTSIIERNWIAMNRHLQIILDNNPDYLWKNRRGADYGDWLAPDQPGFGANSAPTASKELVGTAYLAHSADLLAQMAQGIGRKDDSTRLSNVFERVRKAFIGAYVTDENVVGDGSQTCYILALKFGLLPEDRRRKAAERLAEDIRRRGIALTTGFIGTTFVLDVLQDAGFTELAYDLLLRAEYPSWGYMLREGATTIWESWSGDLEYERRKVKISQNHFALGSICGFLFRRIAAIDAAAPGFETVIVRPALDPRVPRGGGDYDSVMGRISTDWRYIHNGFELVVVIPANTTAHIYVPAPRESVIEEGGEDISRSKDIRVLDRGDYETVIEVGSGRYRFSVRQR